MAGKSGGKRSSKRVASTAAAAASKSKSKRARRPTAQVELAGKASYRSSTKAPPTSRVFDDLVGSAPGRNKHGELLFTDYPAFRPNLTPSEVLQRGSFGGTYFRKITSGVTGEWCGATF